MPKKRSKTNPRVADVRITYHRATAKLGEARSDSGFTLIEVIVSTLLLASVMVMVGGFFAKGVTASAGTQRKQAAVAIADQQMELVRAVQARYDATGLSPLVQGRAQADVTGQWLASTVDGTTTATQLGTVTAWDPSATATSTPTLRYQTPVTVSGQSYTIDTYIGLCRKATSGAECSYANATGVTHFRVIVAVRWDPPKAAACSTGTCQYVLSTLINPDSEPLFNTNVSPVGGGSAPVAVADSGSLPYGTTLSLDLTGNDTGTLGAAPVTIESSPGHGLLSGTIAEGKPLYTPTAGWSGTDTFTYKLTDTTLRVSNTVTVTIVTSPPPAPVAVNDTATTSYGSPVLLDLMRNDLGVLGGTSVSIVTGPTRGSLSGSPSTGNVTYTPDASSTGTDSFTYKLTDVRSHVSGTATVTITVGPPPLPVAVSDSGTTSYGSPVSLTLMSNDTDVLGGAQVLIVDSPKKGNLSGTLSTGQVTYAVNPLFIGTDIFSYQLIDRLSRVSQTVTVTITVVLPPPPVSANWAFTACKNATYPFTFPEMTVHVKQPPIPRGNVSSSGPELKYISPGSNGSDKFEYSLEDMFKQESADITVTVTVKNKC